MITKTINAKIAPIILPNGTYSGVNAVEATSAYYFFGICFFKCVVVEKGPNS